MARLLRFVRFLRRVLSYLRQLLTTSASDRLTGATTTSTGITHSLFTAHLDAASLLAMVARLRAQLRVRATASSVCMLPSFHRALPSGTELGSVVALDVGGSTVRIARVELAGHHRARVVRMVSSAIDEDVKLLRGTEFFDWIAMRIADFLDNSDDEDEDENEEEIRIGLSWSFPIEQTSVRSGKVIAMGKGFHGSDDTVGDDLADLLVAACRRHHPRRRVRVDAIVNDGTATLLARAYAVPSVSMSLILGTGTNAAIHLPVGAIGREKFGERPPEWSRGGVIVNTELSMFGGEGVLPTTRFDGILDAQHTKPGYQPLEYMTTGRYLGEIVRLVVLEAVQSSPSPLFGGHLPPSLSTPYSLDTSLVSVIENDSSPALIDASTLLQRDHPFTGPPPTESDLRFLQSICCAVSTRAAAYLATAIYALCRLRADSDPTLDGTVTIACDGSVISKYPRFRERCQGYLDLLAAEAEAGEQTAVALDLVADGGVVGAAVAVAVAVAPAAEAPLN